MNTLPNATTQFHKLARIKIQIETPQFSGRNNAFQTFHSSSSNYELRNFTDIFDRDTVSPRKKVLIFTNRFLGSDAQPGRESTRISSWAWPRFKLAGLILRNGRHGGEIVLGQSGRNSLSANLKFSFKVRSRKRVNGNV